ncbi:MAG: metal ABC transporter solute-binding protein, Zn/Mn family [Planctomycetota bacterium]|jgi:zinc transport system substrate-binding protein
MRTACGLLACVLLGMTLSCDAESPPAAPGPAQGKIRVFVSILPQAYFVERIAGRHAEIHVLVKPGQSPETYEITPRQMDDLARAQVFFRIGVPFEETLMPRISDTCPNLKIVDTSEGVPFIAMDDHGHDHGRDPHIWLDPNNVKIMADTICDVFTERLPAHAEEFENGRLAFRQDLGTRGRWPGRERLQGRTMYVFHPAFGYFARRYGLKQAAIEREGKAPGARHLDELIREMKSEGVRAIFVQSQHPVREAETIARAIGAEVIELDPLARDYLENHKEMVRKVSEALGGDE